MKSVLQNVKTGVISVESIPEPIIRPGTVLVRNICSLVSAGTEKSVLEFSRASYLQKARQRPDLFAKVLNRVKNEGLLQTYQVITKLIDQPIQLGYSSAGIVREVGAEVRDIQVGQRVACAGLFAATHSEVVAVPRNLLSPIPTGVSFEEACFVTVGSIAMQAVRLAELALSENVVVYGLGLVGMMVAQLAAAAGSRVIGIDIDERKVQWARQFACCSASVQRDMEHVILDSTDGFGADKVILCAATKSNEPIERIPAITRQKGTLVVVGDVSMNIPRRAYYEKEIDIRISRSYGPGRYDLSYEEGGLDYPYAYVRWTENRNMTSVLDLVARRKLDVSSLITHRFGINEAEKAYQVIQGEAPQPYLGIVIRYCDDTPATRVSPEVRYVAHPKNSGVLNIGVIGAGTFAKAFLLPAFGAQKDVRFQGVCSASGVSAAAVARKYGAELATPKAEDIIDNPNLELLLIATRHDSHAKYVMQALRAGKAVYTEKPLALNMDELESIRTLYREMEANEKRPFLMVGYNRRFSPLARSLHDLFSTVGEPISVIYRVNAGFVPATEWVHDPLIGGGRIVGECCHFVDFVSFLARQEARSISATALKKANRSPADVVTLTLDFSNGSVATIHYFANGHSSMPKEYVEVFGGGISAQLVNFRFLKVYGARIKRRTRYISQVKGFAEEARAVIRSLKDGTPAPIPFDQLYVTSKATLMAQQAITSGERIVL